MWTKYRSLVGIGLTVGTGLGIFHAHREAAYAAQAFPAQPQRPQAVDDCPFTTWDENWDRRAQMKRPKREADKAEIDERKCSKACRHIILIRHGQYNLDGASDSERTLTQLGREQAAAVGQRLRALDLPFTSMTNSTMSRARQTADIIAGVLGDSVPKRSEERMLEEGAPAADHHTFRDGARIEAAFRGLFYRPDPSVSSDSYEIVVCHANVIRYFVCRALQFPPEAWLRFSLKHCSITWITVTGSGSVHVRSVGDAGFLPPGKLTTS
ncbi:unnamed protein product [Nesidiocoris tenuis]|uniref:Serine/threonine-protein phosphatase PGAM5, mitochondrial n=1 Tax=Nesidiocoris tenuis TaxID=355587 RepID=A0A6H5HNY5_9HEMI|nr:unnamed protein product [Nesidiocoris tenuis]CAB0018035.1 unnamed protein product [Nesidiocoris tenuis]